MRVEAEDVNYLFERLRRVVRSPRWTPADVIAGFAGLRTLPATDDLHPSSVTREWSLAEPLDGLLVPVGGKLTSARADAAGIVDRVVRRAGWSGRHPSPTRDLPFPWCPPGPFDAWLERTVDAGTALGLDSETAQNCALRHGSRVERILAHVRETPDLGRRIVADIAFCRAEIVHAAREEMARSLEDVPLLLLARLDEEALRDAARLAGGELGWDEARQHEEVAALVGNARGAAVP